MPSLTADTRLFGLDLRQLAREWRQAWSAALRSRWLSWLTPEATVLLHQPDGASALWWNGARQGAAAAGPAGFQAIELPEALLLTCSLGLPAMADADAARALALQAQAHSPFVAEDLLWAARRRAGGQGAAGAQTVDLVLASRRQVAQYLQHHPALQGSGPAPEVWALLPDGAPLVLPGYGEGARRAWALRGRWLRCALLALLLTLLAAIALTPTLQLRLRAIEAVHAYDDLARRTTALVHQREQLLHTADKLGALSGLLTARIEPLRVLDRLTTALPDDAALQGFTLKGSKVTITGLANNSSALMQVLGQIPGVRDVRAPSAATRNGGANAKENFAIEFTLDPQAFGVATAAPAPAPAAAAPAPAAPSAPAAAAAPGTTPGPVFGGSAAPARPASQGKP